MWRVLGCALLLCVSGCSILFEPAAASAPDASGRLNDASSLDASSVDAKVEPIPKRIFVTSSLHSGSLGGLSGADSICQELADRVGLGGQYKAWLSDELESAAERMTHGQVPYALVTGREVASRWDDLVDGTLAEAINRTEAGAVPMTLNQVCTAGEVWTNTKADGARADIDGSASCKGWTSDSFLDVAAVVGILTTTTSQWTESCPTVSCATVLPFYCLEQ